MRIAMLKITEITMDYMKSPIGVDGMPVFGWKIQSDKRNVIQKEYRIQITKDKSFETIMLDSGFVEDRNSTHIKVNYIKLEDLTCYYVRVKFRDEMGEESPFSEASTFVTALLDKKWCGKFIAMPHSKEDKSCSYYFRKEFQVQKEVKSAYLCTTALGVYHVFINERKIGTDELAPGWTSYSNHLLYQVHDVTSDLSAGTQVVGAMLGAGWYKGAMGPFLTCNNYGEQTAFLGELHILYSDGTKDIIISDNSWFAKESPVVFSEIYDGEIYDAGKEIKKWCSPDLSIKDWSNTEIKEQNYSILIPQPGCKVQIMDKIPAKKMFQTKKGDFVLDFEQNLAGIVEFKAKGKPGDRIELQCFETLDQDGNVYTKNLRSAKQSIVYFFGEEEEITFRPYFTYQGFRYIHIKEYPGTPRVEDFKACVLHSAMERTGFFECSHEGINQLQHNILWGMKGNFVDIPTDCPQRDERLGWTGDAQIFCRTASFLMNTYPFYAKWLRDLAYDQTKEGGVPHVIPDILGMSTQAAGSSKEDTHSAAAWADAAVIIPWTMYLVYGDADILRYQYKSMKAWIDFMQAHAKDYVWDYKQQFGDWLALDAEEGSYYGATPNSLITTAYFAYSTNLFAKIAAILDQKEDELFYSNLYQKILSQYQKEFVDESNYLRIKTQTAHIVSLVFHLIQEKDREKITNDLVELLVKEKNHLATGFVGTPYFCHALSQNGRADKAYELLFHEDYPSWLYQVKMGATTIWEHWDGLKPDGTMWSPDMNSFNHYAYGAIGDWLYRVVAGIDTKESEPGYRHLLLMPQVSKILTYAKGRFHSVYGINESGWRIQDENIIYHFVIPANATASIYLENIEELKETDGLVFHTTAKQHCFRAEAGSGAYQIVCTLLG